MNSIIPPTPSASCTEAQIRHLAGWLSEWETETRLPRADKNACHAITNPDQPLTQALPIAPYDADIETVRAGQIRLLSSTLTPDAEQPVYLAILSDWSDKQLLVCPFSRFTQPATMGELSTNRQAAAFRVLQCWNARSVAPAQLLCSWIVDELQPDEADDAYAVFWAATNKTAVPPHLLTRVGPPVLRLNDPRIEYQAQETACLADLCNTRVLMFPFHWQVRELQEALPMAAAGGAGCSAGLYWPGTMEDLAADAGNWSAREGATSFIAGTSDPVHLLPGQTSHGALQFELTQAGSLPLQGGEKALAFDIRSRSLLASGVAGKSGVITLQEFSTRRWLREVNNPADLLLVILGSLS